MLKLAWGTKLLTLSSSFRPATWKVVQNSLKLTKILTKGVANIGAKHARRRRLTIHFVWPRKWHLCKQHNWDGMGQTSGYTVFHELIHIRTKIITFWHYEAELDHVLEQIISLLERAPPIGCGLERSSPIGCVIWDLVCIQCRSVYGTACCNNMRFLSTLVALHFTPVSESVSKS